MSIPHPFNLHIIFHSFHDGNSGVFCDILFVLINKYEKCTVYHILPEEYKLLEH